jgi:hypothetical protein
MTILHISAPTHFDRSVENFRRLKIFRHMQRSRYRERVIQGLSSETSDCAQHSLDISIDRSNASTIANSSHTFFHRQDKPWPIPHSAVDSKGSDQMGDDNDDADSLVGCLCSGIALLNSLLCEMYSEKSNHVDPSLHGYSIILFLHLIFFISLILFQAKNCRRV